MTKCFLYNEWQETTADKPPFQSHCTDQGAVIARVRVEQAQSAKRRWFAKLTREPEGIVVGGPFLVCRRHLADCEAQRPGLRSRRAVLIVEAV